MVEKSREGSLTDVYGNSRNNKNHNIIQQQQKEGHNEGRGEKRRNGKQKQQQQQPHKEQSGIEEQQQQHSQRETQKKSQVPQSEIIDNSNRKIDRSKWKQEQQRQQKPQQEEKVEYEYLFGFGSIMNSSTHAPWLKKSDSAATTDVLRLPGMVATLKRSFGYRRCWSFRSTTGFTALGVCKYTDDDDNKNVDMNGVLFRVHSSMMPGFDRREVGYEKVAIGLEHLILNTGDKNNCGDADFSSTQHGVASGDCFDLGPNDRIWVYVPLPSYCREADENHPLLQSYVDTVLQGCLEWGGEAMAEEFVLSTDGWSSYFLNDTPSSRRPWLFRKEYETIDNILQKHSNITCYGERRHPEEFASAFLIRRMRGTWSLPRRNRSFTGRDAELGEIHARLSNDQNGLDSSSLSLGGVAKLEVVGMGGVGKTQICTEYCYRHFPASYGLVVWLNAESAEALLADYRQLLADLADGSVDDVNAKDTIEVVGEVKTRLFRSHVSWLLVFDNLEDRKLLDKFVPRGAASGTKGHVLVTTRLIEMELGYGSSTLVLGCFSPSESVELIRRALPDGVGGADNNVRAIRELCDRLGHLPLALGMAAAYMQRCDVACDEYLGRYARSEKSGWSLLRHQAGKLHDYSLTVAASLSLSLVAIQKENETASEILQLLCFLGPDQITKALLRFLLHARNKATQRKRECVVNENTYNNDKNRSSLLANNCKTGVIPWGVLAGTLLCASTFAAVNVSGATRRHLGIVGAAVIVSLSTMCTASALIASAVHKSVSVSSTRMSLSSSSSSLSAGRGIVLLGAEKPILSVSASEFEQADQIWNILKSFSLLTIKDGKGSMHRLLSQALRESQDEQLTVDNLEICVTVVRHIWTFQPNKADTWQDSLNVLEHVKSIVLHSFKHGLSPTMTLQTSILSTEVGVFFSMALNSFVEAQASLELALKILDKTTTTISLSNTYDRKTTPDTKSSPPSAAEPCLQQARASALHELGRVFRYEGKFEKAEEALLKALNIRNGLAGCSTRMDYDYAAKQGAVADTLHELGVLEKKKHSLDLAAKFLQRSLTLRRSLYNDDDNTYYQYDSGNDSDNNINIRIDADCANTLHQLAAVYVAQKSPSLQKAESLLKEALGLSRQIGQRAATLKELARVTIRQGLLDRADLYLAQALELYIELYGKERTLHINVAAVKFQQGALAFQREQLKQAWIHFSECLRVRRHVYGYARISSATQDGGNGSCRKKGIGSFAFDYDEDNDCYVDPNPTHLEVSSVLHELGRVAMAQGRFTQARDMLQSEGLILERLKETSSQTDRIVQARWTNLTWLRKCAKEMGDEESAALLAAERTSLRKKHNQRAQQQQQQMQHLPNNKTKAPLEVIQEEALNARLLARNYALVKDDDEFKKEIQNRKRELIAGLASLGEVIEKSPSSEMKDAAKRFMNDIFDCLEKPADDTHATILQSCDTLRDVIRAHGFKVTDRVVSQKKP